MTFKSGNTASQIDYILLNKIHVVRVKNCKVIPGKGIICQHRIVVMNMSYKKNTKRHPLERRKLPNGEV